MRGMSRSDKGCAVSGEENVTAGDKGSAVCGEQGKVTSNQEGIYAVAECDDNFSGHVCDIPLCDTVILNRLCL